MSHARRVVLASLTPGVDQPTTSDRFDRYPSYGVRRVHAAIAADPALADTEVTMVDSAGGTAEEYAERIRALRPDVIGFASYVWSLPTLVETARMIRRDLPDCTILFGGPSAHPVMFDLEPFADRAEFCDGLVLSEGEQTFHDVVAAPERDAGTLSRIPGLAIPTAHDWFRTPPRTPDDNMDTIVSPYQLGLMPPAHVAYLETFRGCPMSCTFCQWGAMDGKRHLSTEYLVRELSAIQRDNPPYVFLIDAGLNLHAKAFRALLEAEREVGLFRNKMLLCEVYPSFLRDEHFDFLSRVAAVHLSLGVQSLDDEVLKTSSRPFRPERLRPIIETLLGFGLVDIELIFGLPGDTPEKFKRTLLDAMELGCNVRVYRCLVLPDALMTRSPAEHQVRFDPYTLELTSCHTWTERALRETHEWIDELAYTHPGGSLVGGHWWTFVAETARYQKAYQGDLVRQRAVPEHRVSATT